VQHVLFRSNTYYFNRRTPRSIREYDSRKLIRFSLKTDSKKHAHKLAALENARLEQYWNGLIETGRKHSDDYYKQVNDRASLLGFSYLTAQQLSVRSLEEILKRIACLQNNLHEKPVEALLGGISAPTIKLDDALAKFWDLTKDINLSKSEHQVRKWKNPRKLAMSNLISCIGNKAVQELTREDMLKFRDWWISRIQTENLTTNVANKNFTYLKVIIVTVSDNFKLNLDARHIFNKLSLNSDYEPRKPFSTEFIRHVLLNADNLSGMNAEAKSLLHIFAETGAGFSELIGLLPEDIVLDCEIPHIAIIPRTKRRLKTKYRKRHIPLTGFALEAFKKFPFGFSHLADKQDGVSSAVGKFLRENNLIPSKLHSVYSLRHSYQDRLLSVNCPDRVQADLMGHKFPRPSYGEGATLEHKLEWMQKITLKSD